MPDQSAKENEKNSGECHKCEVCDFRNCTYQTEIDKMLGIFPYREGANDLTSDATAFTEETFIPGQVTTSQAEVIQPIPIDETPSSNDQVDSKNSLLPGATSSPVKRGRGAPKGNLNALKHGLYMNNSCISNTTPVERARLCDLNGIIEHVKSYIDKAYQNGLTLKETSEINDTLKTISLASIALARLLHTHNQYMVTYLPSNLKGDSTQAVNKMLDFYQKKVGTFFDLTDLQSDQE